MSCDDCNRYKIENKRLKEELRNLKNMHTIIFNGETKDGEFEVIENEGYWTVIEVIENEGRKSYKKTYVNYNDVLYIIQLLRKQHRSVFTAKWVWNLIINDRKLGITIDEFNGGKYRGMHYFPKYYYPLKVLDYLNVVSYDKNGGVTLLNRKDEIEMPTQTENLDQYF